MRHREADNRSTNACDSGSGNRRLKVAIIGLGKVASSHLVAYGSSSEVEVVAGVEPDRSRREAMADRFGFRSYDSHGAMLDNERVDVACVLTPVNEHRQITEDCARAGVHVLCEKPMAVKLEDAERMVSTCRSEGVKLAYGASYRFLPAIAEGRNMIECGDLGDVLLLSETSLGGAGLDGFRGLGFDHYPSNGPGGSGMGMVDHGIHLIDLFPWLLDSPIVSVAGRGNISGDRPATEYAMLNLANGALGHLLYNDATFSTTLPNEGIFSSGEAWNAGGFQAANTWHEQPASISVYGTKGALRIFHYANQLILRDGKGLRSIPILAPPPPAQFTAQMDAFARCIRENEEPAVGGDAGLTALRVLLAVYESARQGRSVAV